jgi:outer membrane protein OmpA-like peptidoglycan-associated protein
MQTVQSIKSRIGKQGAENLGDFLKISENKAVVALGEAMNTMLSGLVKITQTEGSAARILKVINDGGHSGDLVEDLDGLFANKDKLQLLITIGQNINNHFFGHRSESMIDSIVKAEGIDQNTATSLFSLSAPLVLGALGKMARSESLNVPEFTSRILIESENRPVSAFDSLPVTSVPVEAATYYEPSVVTDLPKKRTKTMKKENNYSWIAWILLALLGLAALYFGLKDRINGISANEITKTNIDTSKITTSPEQIFNTPEAQDNTISSTNIPGTASAPAVQSPVPAKKSENTTDANAFISKPEAGSQSEKVLSSGKRQKYADEKNVEVLPSGAVFIAPEAEPYTVESSTDTRPMNFKLNALGSFFAINGLAYKSNGAEIIQTGELNQLISYLKNNPGKNIEIAGNNNGIMPVDRAYALREKLYKSGIPISRIKVVNSVSDTGGPVLVRVN